MKCQFCGEPIDDEEYCIFDQLDLPRVPESGTYQEAGPQTVRAQTLHGRLHATGWVRNVTGAANRTRTRPGKRRVRICGTARSGVRRLP